MCLVYFLRPGSLADYRSDLSIGYLERNFSANRWRHAWPDLG